MEIKQPESANSDENDWTEVASVNDTSYNYTVGDMYTGSTFEFRVKAINAVGSSQYTSTLDIIAATVPSDPYAPIRDD